MKYRMSFSTWVLASTATMAVGYALDKAMKAGRLPGGSMKAVANRMWDFIYRNRDALDAPTRAAVEMAENVKERLESAT